MNNCFSPLPTASRQAGQPLLCSALLWPGCSACSRQAGRESFASKGEKVEKGRKVCGLAGASGPVGRKSSAPLESRLPIGRPFVCLSLSQSLSLSLSKPCKQCTQCATPMGPQTSCGQRAKGAQHKLSRPTACRPLICLPLPCTLSPLRSSVCVHLFHCLPAITASHSPSIAKAHKKAAFLWPLCSYS